MVDNAGESAASSGVICPKKCPVLPTEIASLPPLIVVEARARNFASGTQITPRWQPKQKARRSSHLKK